VSDRLFTVEEAQELLDSRVREMVELLVAERLRSRDLEHAWNAIVIAIGSNGGNFRRSEVIDLRDRLQKLHESLRETLGELADLGIQVKDVDRGLIDFPAVIDGQDALLCWQLGEPRIAHWHTPEDGFAGRRPLP
jgi:hypothetical protein